MLAPDCSQVLVQSGKPCLGYLRFMVERLCVGDLHDIGLGQGPAALVTPKKAKGGYKRWLNQYHYQDTFAPLVLFIQRMTVQSKV